MHCVGVWSKWRPLSPDGESGVRNIAGYNKKVKDARAEGEPLLDPLWKPDEYLANDEQERPNSTPCRLSW